MAEMPEEFQVIGCFNTACGGLRFNGARTSLRNLVVCEGFEMTKTFLTHAARGADLVRFSNSTFGNPFLAELEWLEAVGQKAAKLLDDYAVKLHLLEGVDQIYVRLAGFEPHDKIYFLQNLPAEICKSLSKFDKAADGKLDRERALIYAYLMSSGKVEFIPKEDMNQRLDAVSQTFRGKRRTSFFSKLTRTLN